MLRQHRQQRLLDGPVGRDWRKMSQIACQYTYMSLLPVRDSPSNELQLQLASDREDFPLDTAKLPPGNVMAYVALNPDNVSSIQSSIRLAPGKRQATRPELTSEVWEGINQTYLELEALSYAKMVDQGFREFRI